MHSECYFTSKTQVPDFEKSGTYLLFLYFIDSLILGMKTLMFSASFYEEEEEVALTADEAAKKKKKE